VVRPGRFPGVAVIEARSDAGTSGRKMDSPPLAPKATVIPIIVKIDNNEIRKGREIWVNVGNLRNELSVAPACLGKGESSAGWSGD
jgi:hypothetical protein